MYIIHKFIFECRTPLVDIVTLKMLYFSPVGMVELCRNKYVVMYALNCSIG